MNREEMILSTYMLLKDNLDKNDFGEMHALIEQMSEIDGEKAFDMWYPLLNKYENFVVENHRSTTDYFVIRTLDTLGKSLGYAKFDDMILNDNYLYDLLIKRYCFSISHGDYTYKMLLRHIGEDRIDLADKIFADAYKNGNKVDSWFEIMDGFMFDINMDYFIPNKKAIALLSKWAGKIEGKKDKAKIMSSMLATGLDFDFSKLQLVVDSSIEEENKKSLVNDDDFLFCEVISKYPEVESDRRKLKALLLDFYPNNKLYINIILMVFDEGIIPEIKKMKDSDFLKKQRLIARLTNNYGISEVLATSAIEIWIKGLKSIIEN